MSGGSQLLVRPSIRADECLIDFAARVAHGNGLLQRHVYGLLRDPKSSRRLLQPAVDLATLDVSQRLGKRVWRGKEFKRTELLFQGAAVCPQCLAESGCRPIVWRFWAKAYCVEHAVRLVDQCARCGAPVASTTSQLVHCRCGDDLRRHPATPTSDPALLAFQAAIDAAFAIHVGLPPATTTHPAGALLGVPGGLEFLAHARRWALLSQASQLRPAGRGIAERGAVVAALSRILHEGAPSVLQEARKYWTAARARKPPARADQSQHALMALTRRCRRAPAGSAAHQLATALAEIRDDEANALRVAARRAKSSESLLTIREAAALAGLDVADLQRLVWGRHVPHVPGKRFTKGHACLLERSVVAQLCEFRLKLLSLKEVAGLLGVTESQAQAMRRARVISCAWNRKRYRQSEIPLVQIVRLTERLSALAQEPPPYLAGQLMALNGLARNARRPAVFASTLLKALRGEVSVYKGHPSAVGLGQWSVVTPEGRASKRARQ